MNMAILNSIGTSIIIKISKTWLRIDNIEKVNPKKVIT